jgi:hypothetical protein
MGLLRLRLAMTLAGRLVRPLTRMKNFTMQLLTKPFELAHRLGRHLGRRA